MERDFMGLNSEDPILIKEESVEQGESEDSEYTRTSGTPWQWLNKPSSVLSLKCDRDEKSSKIKSGLIESHAKSGSDMFEAMNNLPSGSIQQNGLSLNHFPMMSPFFNPQFSPDFGGDNNTNQQFLGGLSAPSEQWKTNFKASTTTPQLTIFYGGTVNVFDDITPEKAQAIILLAGNGCATSNISQLKLHMQTAASKFTTNQSMNKQPPTDPTCLVNKVDSPRTITPITSASASAMISSAVPQSRKASLARFLEKRKERAASVAPYNPSKSAAEYATPVK